MPTCHAVFFRFVLTLRRPHPTLLVAATATHILMDKERSLCEHRDAPLTSWHWGKCVEINRNFSESLTTASTTTKKEHGAICQNRSITRRTLHGANFFSTWWHSATLGLYKKGNTENIMVLYDRRESLNCSSQCFPHTVWLKQYC